MSRRKHEITKRRLLVGLGLMVILTVPAVTLADNRTCEFNGSWYGHLPTFQLDFVGTAHGVDSSAGTYSLEIPGLNLALFGFPDAVKLSTFRGTWERIDRRSVAFTVVAYAVDSFGQTVVIGKISGIDTFTEDCGSITIKNTTELFGPGQDPFGGEMPDYSYFRGQDHSASRMRVDPPAEPL